MDLQFKPEMYLNGSTPAGYDVDLLHKLAAYAHVKLVIKNLGFNGLIPGLQTKKFDMVSVGLSPTAARAEGRELQQRVRAVRADRRGPGRPLRTRSRRSRS